MSDENVYQSYEWQKHSWFYHGSRTVLTILLSCGHSHVHIPEATYKRLKSAMSQWEGNNIEEHVPQN